MVKLAIIGMGDMGSKYAKWILQSSDLGFTLVAATRIKDVYLDRIKEYLSPDFKFYQSDRELFAAFDNKEFELDAVLVVTPHYAHEYSVKEAFKRGLNVLCDKPAGVYLRQAREMLEAKCDDKSYGFIFHQRLYPVNQKLKELVTSGVYGKVKRVSYTMTEWYRTNAYYKSAPWRATYKTDGGGTLLNQCPHSIDLLCYLFGMPVSVFGVCHEGKYHNIEVEDEATAYLEWANGVSGVFIASTGECPGVNRLEISFERAVVTASGNTIEIRENDKDELYYRNQDIQYLELPESKVSTIKFDKPDNSAYLEVLKAFAKSINGTGCVVASGEDSIMSLYVANAVYLSSAQRKVIELAPLGCEAELKFEKDFESWLNNKV